MVVLRRWRRVNLGDRRLAVGVGRWSVCASVLRRRLLRRRVVLLLLLLRWRRVVHRRRRVRLLLLLLLLLAGAQAQGCQHAVHGGCGVARGGAWRCCCLA